LAWLILSKTLLFIGLRAKPALVLTDAHLIHIPAINNNNFFHLSKFLTVNDLPTPQTLSQKYKLQGIDGEPAPGNSSHFASSAKCEDDVTCEIPAWRDGMKERRYQLFGQVTLHGSDTP